MILCRRPFSRPKSKLDALQINENYVVSESSDIDCIQHIVTPPGVVFIRSFWFRRPKNCLHDIYVTRKKLGALYIITKPWNHDKKGAGVVAIPSLLKAISDSHDAREKDCRPEEQARNQRI